MGKWWREEDEITGSEPLSRVRAQFTLHALICILSTNNNQSVHSDISSYLQGTLTILCPCCIINIPLPLWAYLLQHIRTLKPVKSHEFSHNKAKNRILEMFAHVSSSHFSLRCFHTLFIHLWLSRFQHIRSHSCTNTNARRAQRRHRVEAGEIKWKEAAKEPIHIFPSGACRHCRLCSSACAAVFAGCGQRPVHPL